MPEVLRISEGRLALMRDHVATFVKWCRGTQLRTHPLVDATLTAMEEALAYDQVELAEGMLVVLKCWVEHRPGLAVRAMLTNPDVKALLKIKPVPVPAAAKGGG